jgi:hypothetical protein
MSIRRGTNTGLSDYSFPNPLKPKLILIIFKPSDLTSKKMQPETITKNNWLKLLKEIVTACLENRTKPTGTLCGQNAELFIVKTDGKSSYY